MLTFFGRFPNDITQYRCEECKTEFDIRHSDWEDLDDYLEPMFCPICGKSAGVEEQPHERT